MSLSGVENLVYDIKLSSVGPANVTSQGTVHEPSSMDLVMKLHYLRGVYFFNKEAVDGFTIKDFKAFMFKWLNLYYVNCGRFRRSETERPFIKCNDCGVRVAEAKCKISIEEWLEMEDCTLNRGLVRNQVLGHPELRFSPLVLIQLTWFKCGGMSIGLSWAHVLGDAFSATDFINVLGQIMEGRHPVPQQHPTKPQKLTQTLEDLVTVDPEPLSVKRVNPVGDHWIATDKSNMGVFSFQVTSAQLQGLLSETNSQLQSQHGCQISSFETLSALVWHCLAEIRRESEPRVITVVKNGSYNGAKRPSGNNQIVSIVKVDLPVVNSNPAELAQLMIDGMVENSQIEQAMEKDNGVSDFVLYGKNLTFVDLVEADMYGLVLKEKRPIFVNYTIDGVGDEGVVLVLPGPDKGGRTVTVIVPEDQVLQLRTELLQRKWRTA